TAAYGVDLTADGINEFAGRLAELGFLETAPSAPTAVPAPVPAEATPLIGTKVPELDNAEDEWNAPEGAKTATFTPDAAMLDSPPDLTPVAPELPQLEDEASDVAVEETPPPAAASAAPAPAPRLFDIPPPAAAAAKAPAPPND